MSSSGELATTDAVRRPEATTAISPEHVARAELAQNGARRAHGGRPALDHVHRVPEVAFRRDRLPGLCRDLRRGGGDRLQVGFVEIREERNGGEA